MPIWLRKFTFSKIKEYYEAQEKESPKNLSKTPSGPDISPTYSSKFTKK